MYALKGRNYCKKHGGKRGLAQPATTMSHYRKNAGPKLKKVLEELAEESSDDRIQLDDEIDLARAASTRAMRLWEMACIDKAADTSDKVKVMATASLRTAVGHVAALCSQQAKITAASQATMDVEGAGWLVVQVTKAINDELREDYPSLADRLVKRLDSIQLPSSTTKVVLV